ncbi:MAG: hypothetical protein BAJATHORv1_20240 [Candidatus Thorarchaeota archaeon]|nr:MAG: hypothetical protein BAJATHORv1_20240 [Candidatus Thorarchaeota archaeon]
MVVSKNKIEEIVAETMANHPEIEGMIVCNAEGEVLFGHTLSATIMHKEVAEFVVKISTNSSQLVNGLDQGGLKEIDISAETGFVMIFGDVKLILAAFAGESARESLGLVRMALRRALVSMIG